MKRIYKINAVVYHIIESVAFIAFSFFTMLCNNCMIKILFPADQKWLLSDIEFSFYDWFGILFWGLLPVVLFVVLFFLFIKNGKRYLLCWRKTYYFTLLAVSLLSVYLPYIVFLGNEIM